MPEHTIAENLSRLVTSKTNIANAIITMGGTVNSEDGFEEFPADIATIPSGGGGGGSSYNVINFYDYDGTIVQSYSADDFANLSELPANPTHAGLTTQGWNWSLTDAKAYVAKYGSLNIGQMYITTDGKTRLYFTVTKNNLSAEFNLDLEPDTELDIDWGDGSEHTRWTSDDEDWSKSHDYTSAGRYVIAIIVVAGEFHLSQSSSLPNVHKIEIGNSVTSIGDHAFDSYAALTSITIPDSVTSIGESAFYDCSALSSITIPDSVTSIGGSAFSGCNALPSITFESSTPPTSGTFEISHTCIIRVPQGSLLAYTSAENYPDPSEYIYEEY